MTIKDSIMEYMKEQKKVQYIQIQVMFRHIGEFERALFSLIDENKLEDVYEHGIRMIKLGPAI